MYTTAQQMLNRFGATRLAQLAAPNEPAVTADLFELTITGGDRSAFSTADIAEADAALSRLNDAIDRADNIIDSYVRSQYTLPLEQDVIDASPLPTGSMDIAIYDLSGVNTTEDEETRHKHAISWLRDLAKGLNTLGQRDNEPASTNGYHVKTSESHIDWSAY